jgi:hypothetical protein
MVGTTAIRPKLRAHPPGLSWQLSGPAMTLGLAHFKYMGVRSDAAATPTGPASLRARGRAPEHCGEVDQVMLSCCHRPIAPSAAKQTVRRCICLEMTE